MGRPNKKRMMVQLVAVGLTLFGLLAWFVRAQTKPLDRDGLRIEVGDLRSNSSEAVLIAQQTLAGKTAKTFFEVQSYLITGKVKSSKNQLDGDSLEPGWELPHWQARQLSGRLKTAVEKLSGAFGQDQEIKRTKAELEDLSRQLKELEESLK